MSSLAVPSMPELSLTNELWTGFVLGYIYEHKCTYLDVICASPLAPAMVSYQLDLFRDSDAVKQHNPHVLGQTVHAHSGPMGARGNITAFMMPWEDVYFKFEELCLDNNRDPLPRVGRDLADVVHVVLRAHVADTHG